MSAVYVVNMDELQLSLGDTPITANIDLTSVETLINEVLNEVKKPSGNQKIKGKTLSVPPNIGTYSIIYTAETNILLTGIIFSQSAYKSGDYWDLKVNGITIFSNIYTKEMPEKKTFNKYYAVPVGQNIELILYNESGNSRQLYVDFEYITLI